MQFTPRKPLQFWEQSVVNDYRKFPADIQDDGGYQLDRLQQGLDPDDFKPMAVIGAGAFELRLRDDSNAFRVIYVVKFEDAVWVLHAFQKTTQKTSNKDIQLAKERFAKLLQLKSEEKALQKKTARKTASGKTAS
ncbi:MAG: type II toxin-antitoxin system RelE/ParE family toxin [Comamonas sp.]|uniref:type II toxin-antitoxin system RelE/ParE family toxin n=1 Tax=Comamonas sp. TaxID=34028 RepID=UPI003D0D4464